MQDMKGLLQSVTCSMLPDSCDDGSRSKLQCCATASWRFVAAAAMQQVPLTELSDAMRHELILLALQVRVVLRSKVVALHCKVQVLPEDLQVDEAAAAAA
jgi:hypothetical protein